MGRRGAGPDQTQGYSAVGGWRTAGCPGPRAASWRADAGAGCRRAPGRTRPPAASASSHRWAAACGAPLSAREEPRPHPGPGSPPAPVPPRRRYPIPTNPPPKPHRRRSPAGTHVKKGGKLYCHGHAKLIATDTGTTSASFRSAPAHFRPASSPRPFPHSPPTPYRHAPPVRRNHALSFPPAPRTSSPPPLQVRAPPTGAVPPLPASNRDRSRPGAPRSPGWSRAGTSAEEAAEAWGE